MKTIRRKIRYRREQIFADSLTARGLKFIYQPAVFHVGAHQYRPDFYVPSENTFYEVVGTRQAFQQNKKKIELVRQIYPFVRLKLVTPQGSPYAVPDAPAGIAEIPWMQPQRWSGTVKIDEFNDATRLVANFLADGHTTHRAIEEDLNFSQGTLHRLLNPMAWGTPHTKTRAKICNYANYLAKRFPLLVRQASPEPVNPK